MRALDAEVLPGLFWSLSIAEVCDMLESRARVRQRQQKERLNAASYIVDELGIRISIMLGNKEAKINRVWDYFPSLYQEEKELADQMHREAELEHVRESRHNFAAVHNRYWKEVRDDGECENATDSAGSNSG